jgi:integrase
LKRPWDAVTKHADLVGVRLHGGGLGLPIIGRLLGHAQAATTTRYAHLDNDPLRRASEAIAGHIAAALEGNPKSVVVPLKRYG